MEVEIELKLNTQAEAGPIIAKWLQGQSKIKVEHQEIELSNSYFDTPNRDFRKNDMGLRIRGLQHEYEQTLKTAGKGVAGLQHRPEYNVSLGLFETAEPRCPDLHLFPADIWPTGFHLEHIQQTLVCQFSTQFTREQFLLTWPDETQVELVWDRGVVQASGLSDPISEIELELKKGKVERLFSLARQLAELMPLAIGLQSKAARGYRLIDMASAQAPAFLKTQQTLSNAEELNQMIPDLLPGQLAKVLKQWQKMDLSQDHNLLGRSVELSELLVLLTAIVKRLNHANHNAVLQDCLHHLCAFQDELSKRQQAVRACKPESIQQAEAKQALRAFALGKSMILLQLDMMQWLSEA